MSQFPYTKNLVGAVVRRAHIPFLFQTRTELVLRDSARRSPGAKRRPDLPEGNIETSSTYLNEGRCRVLREVVEDVSSVPQVDRKVYQGVTRLFNHIWLAKTPENGGFLPNKNVLIRPMRFEF